MALTKPKKQEVIEEVSGLLADAKMTVIAAYPGTSVKAMQSLRRDAKENSTTIKVFKNRLVKLALSQNDTLKGVDTSPITGQLLYAFNSEDEVAPAQALANFAKTSPTIEFVGAITADGTFIEATDVKALASLPSKEQLRAQLVGTIAAPLSGFANVLAGNVRGIINVLNARADQLGA
jgi:large subunit ribosomal protein L10